MFMNFMDYVNDNCMNLFTNGQKDRMLAALNSNARKGLKNAVACRTTPTPWWTIPSSRYISSYFPTRQLSMLTSPFLPPRGSKWISASSISWGMWYGRM